MPWGKRSLPKWLKPPIVSSNHTSESLGGTMKKSLIIVPALAALLLTACSGTTEASAEWGRESATPTPANSGG